mmetsp:Transcript_30643/g.46407  ORF Transcript_30643/g.46407 Transcript_30643/m.46407 type:complete len:1059 (-) Transcript_30643:84-3260(-)
MSIELVDKIDQANKAAGDVGSVASNPNRNKPYRKVGLGDLLLTEEDDGGSIKTISSRSVRTGFSLKSARSHALGDEEPDYIGMELDSVLKKRARNRRSIFLAVVVLLLSLIVAVSFSVGRKPSTVNSHGSPNQKPLIGNENDDASDFPDDDSTLPDDDGAVDSNTEVGAWPIAAPNPKFNICPPKLRFKHHHNIIHLTNIEIVPEAKLDENWEYTFSDMDISDDASIIAVGLSDFGGNIAIEAGLVRVFAHACNEHMQRGSWKQLGQDLIGSQDQEGFGAAVSSSRDGSVIAISATQDGIEGANGYVQVYYLDEDDDRPTWKELGQRLEDLEDTCEYWNLGTAIDLSENGETIAILGVLAFNKFVTRVFDYDYEGKKWTRKGHDLTIEIETGDDYSWDIQPRISLNEDGSKLNMVDPKFGLVEYMFNFKSNKWTQKEAVVTTSFSEDTYINSIAFDDAASVLAFEAYDYGGDDTMVVGKLVDFEFYSADEEKKEFEFFNVTFPDLGVGVGVDVSSDGQVAAIVAYKASMDDSYEWNYDDIGSMTVLSKNKEGQWKVVGEGTDEAELAVPGSMVTLSRDGSIAAVGTDAVIALYGINLNHDPVISNSETKTPSLAPTTEETKPVFELCAPFPNATKDDILQLVDLPHPTLEDDDDHSLSIALSSDGTIIAVGIEIGQRGDDTSENYDSVLAPGLVRAYGYSCDDQRYMQIGSDLFGDYDLDGFGIAIDLSDDGKTLVIGANQPAPGKSGYVNIYELKQQESSDGEMEQDWILDHQVTTVDDGIMDDETVQDLGREVRISADGTTVAIHGSFVDKDENYLSSFIRTLQITEEGEWVRKGSDLRSSILYNEYGTNVKLAFSADGQTLGVTGSYNTFSAKLYTYDTPSKNWTETVLLPFKPVETEDGDSSSYDWDEYCSEYFDGTDLSLNADGTAMAIAGIQWTNEEAIVRLLTRPSIDDLSASSWTISHDILEFADEYVAYSMDLSADASVLAIGFDITGSESQGTLAIIQANDSDAEWKLLGAIEGNKAGDMLGARVRLSSDGTIAAATSKHGYVSFLKK